MSITHTFIEADNLLGLQFLQRSYFEKIGLIYIDPPYNTGKTNFTYNDSFNHKEWLDFMKERLILAKNLLCENGCIFISIGQESLYVLKILCDEIFGEKNFVNDFMWLCGKGKKNKFSRTMQQSTLCYAKNLKKLKPFVDYEIASWANTNIDNDERGAWFSGSISFSEERSNSNHPNYFELTSPTGIKWLRQWQIDKAQMDELIAQNKIYWGPPPKYNNVPRKKVFNGEKIKIIPKNIIGGISSTRDAQNYLDALLEEKNCFDNPKPVDLIEHFLKITNMERDIIVLDFFAGSGTVFEAVVNQNQKDGGTRKCILIQKPEKIQKKSKYKTISELCQARIKKVNPPADNIEFIILRNL